MRKIRTFMDLALYEADANLEHQKRIYNNIYGKIMYPVAFNPLDCSKKQRWKNRFKSSNYRVTITGKYGIIR